MELITGVIRVSMKGINESFKEMGGENARARADELAVKNALPMGREEFIEKETKKEVSALQEKFKSILKQMEKSSAVLQEEMAKLPQVEKDRCEKEFKEAGVKLKEAVDLEESLKESTLQAFLGITDPTLAWVYDVGYGLFEGGKLEEALGVFQTLALLSPMVRDYWMALGFVQEGLGSHDRSIEAFSYASLLDPDYAPSRYQSAKAYLHLGAFEDAKAELEVLSQIIEKQKLESLRPHFQDLQNKANNKQKL